MALTLYKMDASPPVRAVYMVIDALKLPNVEYVETDLLADDHLKDDFLKINPQHTIPHLTDGNFQLSDSHAIITYLMNKYGKNSDLYPSDPQQRAMIDQKLHFDSGILYPALRENDEPIFFGTATSLKPEGVAKIRSAYDFTEKFLTGSQWLAGNKLTVADISCVATVSTLNELLHIDEATYPNICAWINRCAEHEFYKNGNQPGLMGVSSASENIFGTLNLHRMRSTHRKRFYNNYKLQLPYFVQINVILIIHKVFYNYQPRL